MKCRNCKYYTFEGRREGYCALLCAPMEGELIACSYSVPPFIAIVAEVESAEDPVLALV
jgi:hypothetical protein